MITEGFRTLFIDPGEDTGWCQGVGDQLIGAGTTKMNEFAHDVWAAVTYRPGPKPVGYQLPYLNDPRGPWVRDEAPNKSWLKPIGRIVCEDFRIYPWEAQKGTLNWDQVRTARLIGKLEFIAELHEIPFILQGANIKKRAVAGGAEELFYRPLHENRHQNDAIMHFVYFTQTELRGVKLLEDSLTTGHHPV